MELACDRQQAVHGLEQLGGRRGWVVFDATWQHSDVVVIWVRSSREQLKAASADLARGEPQVVRGPHECPQRVGHGVVGALREYGQTVEHFAIAIGADDYLCQPGLGRVSDGVAHGAGPVRRSRA